MKKRYRKTGGGILGIADRVKKPLGGILAVIAIVTMLGFAGHDDLAEAQAQAEGVEIGAYEENCLEIEAITEEPENAAETGDPEPEWTSLGEFKITAYCSCVRCCSVWAKNRPVDENGEEIVYTASGERAEAGKTIAVDPDVIPLGTKVKIGDAVYTAQDTGSMVKGNVIDIYFDSHESAVKHGVAYMEVEVRS